MTDNEIIKALDGCISSNCSMCPHNKEDGCTDALIKDAIDLIDGQRLEIVNLRATIDSFTDIGKLYSEIKAEAIKEFCEKRGIEYVETDI